GDPDHDQRRHPGVHGRRAAARRRHLPQPGPLPRGQAQPLAAAGVDLGRTRWHRARARGRTDRRGPARARGAGVTRYGFTRALGGFFHADATRLARLLPGGLRPLESHPDLGVLALTVFDFDESEVGRYRELVVSAMVPPWAPRGEPLPDAALFPILLATTTDRSRAHAALRWKLPELDRCLAIEFDGSAELERVRVGDGHRPLLQL